jgi:hypothetical protein
MSTEVWGLSSTTIHPERSIPEAISISFIHGLTVMMSFALGFRVLRTPIRLYFFSAERLFTKNE